MSVTSLVVRPVRVEHHADPLGIGQAQPRLTWSVVTEVEGWSQSGYELEIARPDGSVRDTTGRVDSAESVLVAWPGAPLTSRERVAVRVRVWSSDAGAGAGGAGAAGKQSAPSGWSEPVWVEAAESVADTAPTRTK